MEFPELGANCWQENCNQLDFLPVKCDGCEQKFCSQHWKYEAHRCPGSYLKDAQVPICPLCDQPVPSSRSLLPDIAVSAHIDRHCKSDPALKKRNRCSVSRCKQKEFVKILCEECELNFCLKHRHKEDHKCQGSGSKSKKDTTSRAGVAALQRAKQTNFIIQSPTLKDRVFMPSSLSANFSAFQGGLNEDEALKRALQRSIQETIGSSAETSQEEQDRILAEAIVKSEQEFYAQGRPEILASGSDAKMCLLQ